MTHALLHRSRLEQFREDSGRSGTLLLRGCPIGETPTTPARPVDGPAAGPAEEFLLNIASMLGEPVGYEPELGGAIVQNIVPVAGSERQQVSTSSSVTLAWHTETAFHPDAPHYLVLLCRRGDPSAATQLSSIHDVLPLLDETTVSVLRSARFRTRPDASFLADAPAGGRTRQYGPPMAVLSGDGAGIRFVFDEELMVGMDPEASAALVELAVAVRRAAVSIVLDDGDLVVIDNHVTVHGRTPFSARYDGTDRWLQRSFVVDDLAPSADRRNGRIITTRF